MPMRPIDAVFVQPSQQFYVVYHKGELWQMPRLKLDIDSWERKKPYQDAISALYLSKYQYITDPELAEILTTYELPESLHGCSLDKFKNWWQMYGQLWINNPNKYHDDEEILSSLENPENNHNADDQKQTIKLELEPTETKTKKTTNKKTSNKPPKISKRPTGKTTKSPRLTKKNKNKTTKNASKTENDLTGTDFFDSLLNKLNNEMYEKKP